MLTIRFSRVGKKKQPLYRIIISEKHKDPWGNYLELLGNFNPHTKAVVLKADRIKYWLSKGAQLSNSIHNLLIKEGIILETKKKKAVSISQKRTTKMNKIKEEKQAAEAKVKATAEAEKTNAKAAAKAVAETPVAETKPEKTLDETPAEAQSQPAEQPVTEEIKTE